MNQVAVVKYCPVCSQPLIERTNRTTGSAFLGCSRWPECTHTEPVPESVKLRRAGQADMFDFYLAPEPEPVTPPASEPRKHEQLVPAGARRGTCRSCSAPVIWITTANGRSMPVSEATIVTRDGQRYGLSHFSDCPQAKGWSKK